MHHPQRQVGARQRAAVAATEARKACALVVVAGPQRAQAVLTAQGRIGRDVDAAEQAHAIARRNARAHPPTRPPARPDRSCPAAPRCPSPRSGSRTACRRRRGAGRPRRNRRRSPATGRTRWCWPPCHRLVGPATRMQILIRLRRLLGQGVAAAACLARAGWRSAIGHAGGGWPFGTACERHAGETLVDQRARQPDRRLGRVVVHRAAVHRVTCTFGSSATTPAKKRS